MQLWPAQKVGLATTEVVKMYDAGFVGAYEEPEERDRFEDRIRQSGGYVRGEEAAAANGFADSGEGKLSIPFVHALELFPGCLPGPGQDRGDCVSHNEKNANLISAAVEIAIGAIDEVTGKIERVPEIPTAGLLQGAFSTEVFYWFRGHGGDGWSCDSSARVAMKEAGLVTRDDHTATIGVDLTRYSGRLAGRYGRRPPAEEIAQHLDDNLIRQATTLSKREARRDFLANGYGLSTCGSEGFSNKRDEHGVSRRRGSWAHALGEIAFDDRPWAHEVYGDSLELMQNSWNVWNGGPRDIHDSAQFVPEDKRDLWIRLGIVNAQTGNIMIPKGAFWARSRDVARRRVIAKSSVNGWPKRGFSLGYEAF